MYVCITVPTLEERFRIGELIHNQLIKNKDYVHDRIILNVDQGKTDKGYQIHLYVLNNSETDPVISF